MCCVNTNIWDSVEGCDTNLHQKKMTGLLHIRMNIWRRISRPHCIHLFSVEFVNKVINKYCI